MAQLGGRRSGRPVPRLVGRLVGRRDRRGRAADLLAIVVLLAFVVSVYIVVVLGGGLLIGRPDPSLGLSVLATAIVALAFGPVQSVVEGRLARAAYGGRQSPYEVLSRFTQTVTGSSAGEQVASQMAKILAEGTDAAWTEVWLVLDQHMVLAASWPPEHPAVQFAEPTDAADDAASGRRALPVDLGGERLAVLRLQELADRALTPVGERLFAGLAAQAGPVLHRARLRAELDLRLVELSARARDLQRSRERLVDAEDAARRQLERDIHDGAQQHLVALAVNLRLAQTLVTKAPERARAVIGQQLEATRVAIETLDSLSHGIYPPVLSAGGIAVALRAATSTGAVRVTVRDGQATRHSAALEAAVYFCCLEALQNAAKHAQARSVEVDLHETAGRLEFSVRDDGIGFTPPEGESEDPHVAAAGGGLANMRDRIDSAGGRLIVGPAAGGGTLVSGWVPTGEAT